MNGKHFLNIQNYKWVTQVCKSAVGNCSVTPQTLSRIPDQSALQVHELSNREPRMSQVSVELSNLRLTDWFLSQCSRSAGPSV